MLLMPTAAIGVGLSIAIGRCVTTRVINSLLQSRILSRGFLVCGSVSRLLVALGARPVLRTLIVLEVAIAVASHVLVLSMAAVGVGVRAMRLVCS